MSTMKIEVFDDEQAATQRASYFQGAGFTVSGPSAHWSVSWENHTANGLHDDAVAPANSQVWLVTAVWQY